MQCVRTVHTGNVGQVMSPSDIVLFDIGIYIQFAYVKLKSDK
jgi:hypothetical protein